MVLEYREIRSLNINSSLSSFANIYISLSPKATKNILRVGVMGIAIMLHAPS